MTVNAKLRKHNTIDPKADTAVSKPCLIHVLFVLGSEKYPKVSAKKKKNE